MFDLLKWRKSFFGAVIVAFLGFAILPACSSSEETPPPEEAEATSQEGTCNDADPNFEECMEEKF